MDDNKILTLSLPVKNWNRIRSAMGKLPYEDIADLFGEMNKQFEIQLDSLTEKEVHDGQEK